MFWEGERDSTYTHQPFLQEQVTPKNSSSSSSTTTTTTTDPLVLQEQVLFVGGNTDPPNIEIISRKARFKRARHVSVCVCKCICVPL